MNTNICTSIKQSKKLIELEVDVNTADMCHRNTYSNNNFRFLPCADKAKEPITGDIPAWSLSALLSVLPEPSLIQNQEGKWLVRSWDRKRFPWSVGGYNNPIDACVAMIEKLHEQKLI